MYIASGQGQTTPRGQNFDVNRKALSLWPGPFEQTFVPPSHGGSILYLTLIGQAISEKMFKECGRRTTDRRATEAYLSYKLTCEPSAQVS